MSHPHGCVSWNLGKSQKISLTGLSHPHGCVSWNLIRFSEAIWIARHTLTGVWVEIAFKAFITSSKSHTLTGVWVEITADVLNKVKAKVTPSRVCELKCFKYSIWPICKGSHPHGCVSWNSNVYWGHTRCNGHTLTGVWVEIAAVKCGEKVVESHPHGCVSWNLLFLSLRLLAQVTPSRVCELKCDYSREQIYTTGSHPHGCVSWNAWRSFLSFP